MNEEKYKICSDRIIWRRIDSETMILDLEKDIYYSLNDVGARIWELLDKGTSIKRINEIICEEYDVDDSTASKDIAKIIEKFGKEKLIICKKQ